IDEDRDNHAPGVTLGHPHQRKMALVHRAHGGHERDGIIFLAPPRDCAAQSRNGAHNEGSTGHPTVFAWLSSGPEAIYPAPRRFIRPRGEFIMSAIHD